MAVAEAAAATPSLSLIGVEAFEGVLHDAEDAPAVASLLVSLRTLAEELAARQLFDGDADEVIISAGGSVRPDRVRRTSSAGSTSDGDSRGRVRSGCYLTHDSGFYERHRRSPRGCVRRSRCGPPCSRGPSPTLALVGMGKHDVSHDIDLPVPQSIVHSGSGRSAARSRCSTSTTSMRC